MKTQKAILNGKEIDVVLEVDEEEIEKVLIPDKNNLDDTIDLKQIQEELLSKTMEVEIQDDTN